MSSSLANVVFWTAAVCCAVAQAALLRSVLTVRPIDRPASAVGPLAPVRRGAELLWAVVPALALAAVLFLTWRAMHPRAAAAPASPGAVIVSAGGRA
jgi:heme/copper-type cytochrome/quinol oxidase subunit 2